MQYFIPRRLIFCKFESFLVLTDLYNINFDLILLQFTVYNFCITMLSNKCLFYLLLMQLLFHSFSINGKYVCTTSVPFVSSCLCCLLYFSHELRLADHAPHDERAHQLLLQHRRIMAESFLDLFWKSHMIGYWSITNKGFILKKTYPGFCSFFFRCCSEWFVKWFVLTRPRPTKRNSSRFFAIFSVGAGQL